MTSTSEQLDRAGDPDFMSSLARGLAVLRCVAEARQPVTIADVCRGTRLSRAAARRCLYTLGMLGYVGQDQRGYSLRRPALALGSSFLSTRSLASRSQPLLDGLRDELGESCSLGIVDDDALLYAARAEASRIMAVGLRVGSRLPLYATSMGRVLLAGRSSEELRDYLARAELAALTPRTVTDGARLEAIVRQAALDGFAIVDEELEIGVRSIAVPVTSHGAIVAALNVGAAAARITRDDLRRRMLPALRSAAGRLSS